MWLNLCKYAYSISCIIYVNVHTAIPCIIYVNMRTEHAVISTRPVHGVYGVTRVYGNVPTV